MLSFTGSLKVFVALQPCDLRKSFNGLHGLVTERLGEDPRTGALFVFVNQRRHQTTFNIPIWYSINRLPVASAAWKTIASSQTKRTERAGSH